MWRHFTVIAKSGWPSSQLSVNLSQFGLGSTNLVLNEATTYNALKPSIRYEIYISNRLNPLQCRGFTALCNLNNLITALNDVNGSVCCMKIDAIVSPGETLKATWFVIKCLNLSNRKLLFSNTSQADSGRRGTERLNELIIRRST